MPTKYIIQVVKIEERDELKRSAHEMMGIDDGDYDKKLFTGEMTADETVEILDRLYKLKMRR